MKNQVITGFMILLGSASLMGCWVAAGAVGAEAGYVASQEKRTAGETFDDQTTLASVKTKLIADPEVSGLKINVDIFKGAVILRGYVPTESEIERAIKLARETNGVKSVESRLVLDKP